VVMHDEIAKTKVVFSFLFIIYVDSTTLNGHVNFNFVRFHSSFPQLDLELYKLDGVEYDFHFDYC
jgi:hypothetical protein